MPTYLFLDKNTNKESTKFMSISECEKYLADNPHIEQLVNGFPSLGDSVRLGVKKPDETFRDILRRIKKNNAGSNINIR